jgi:hypothetical protein
MLKFARNALIKSTFRSTLKAAKVNPLATQKDIANFIFSRLNGLIKSGASEVEWRMLVAETSQRRQAINAAGNNSESNPDYAKYALLESAATAVALNDSALKESVLGELFEWFKSLGMS